MKANTITRKDRPRHRFMLRIVLCTLILLFGLGGFIGLASLKKPPAEAKISEHPLKVAVSPARAEDIAVMITGFGQVNPLNVVRISSEVAGRIVAVHPHLEVGETISRGELLIQIDERDTCAAADRAKAETAQWTSTLRRLEKQSVLDAERLKTLDRNRELAQKEFARISELFKRHAVGTRTGVEKAEQTYNTAADLADQMAQTVALYPMRIEETRSSLAAARAGLMQAEADLERCRIKAPFSGRLKMVAVEQGQYVVRGQELVTMADDTTLEIQVPLDSRDVRQWLRFKDSASGETGSWFDRLVPVACRIRWTEEQDDHGWVGHLHRVVAFDPKTRTVTVAVRVMAAEARGRGAGMLPLVEGMFCQVHIPGRTLTGAFRLPRQAVSFQNTVYTVVDSRIKTVNVEVARLSGEEAFIVGGLKSGDQVITTRLVDPLENALVAIQ
jgi:RND family efflux transporter MFP subunit